MKLEMSVEAFKAHIAKLASRFRVQPESQTADVRRGRVWKYYDGMVILNDFMGGDLSVVNAARVSFNRQAHELSSGDVKLINFLADHKHMSPFRHVQIQVILQRIPEFVLRQLYKHQVGMGYSAGDFREAATVWNEVSGRYVEFDIDFFEPTRFRLQHETNKQASYADRSIHEEDSARQLYRKSVQASWSSYQELLSLGVAKEQARMVIPLSFNTSVMWTGSLEAFAHFVRLRTHEGAQVEIQELAHIIGQIVEAVAPHSTRALLGEPHV